MNGLARLALARPIAGVAALTLASVAPHAALALGTVTGNSPVCNVTSSENVTVNHVAVVQGSLQPNCPTAGTTPGSSYGPTHSTQPPPGPAPPGQFKPGDPCHYYTNAPDTFTPPGTLNRLYGPPIAGTGQFYPDQAQAAAITMLFNYQDAYEPFLATGTYDKNGNCNVTLVQSLCDIGQAPLTHLPDGENECWVFQPPPRPLNVPGGFVGPGFFSTLFQAVGTIKGLVKPGQISSTPSSNGLVNTQTCFYLDGLNVPQSQTYEITILGPDMGEGRHLFFVLRIQVSYQGTHWDFGDGSSQEVTPDSAYCGGSTAPVQTAHVYQHFSQGQPGDTFEVTATEAYNVDVTEFWDEQDGTQSIDFGSQGQDFTLTTPAYPQHEVQEEGVPIGG